MAALDALPTALRELMCAGHPRDAAANGSDVRGIRRRSETQGLNVLGSKTKVRKLFIMKLSEPRPYTLLAGVILRLNNYAPGSRGLSGAGPAVRSCLAAETESS